MTSPRRLHLSRRAFTLVELIVVIVILGLLAAVGAFSYSAVTDHTRKAAAHAAAEQFARDVVGVASGQQSAVSTLQPGQPGSVLGDVTDDLPADVTVDWGTAETTTADIVAGVVKGAYCTPVQFLGSTPSAYKVGTATKASTCTTDNGLLPGDGGTVTPPRPPYDVTVLADHPEMFYRLDGQSGTTQADSSGNNRPLDSYTGTAPTPVAGDAPKSTSALGWDTAAGSLRTTYSQAMPTTAGTFELWTKFPTAPTTAVALAAWSPRSGVNGSTSVLELLPSGRIRLGLWTAGAWSYVGSVGALSTGNWHHVVASWSAAGGKVRIDKVTLGTNPAATYATNAAGANFRLHGSWMGSADIGTVGAVQLADVAWYATQLTDAQTDAHYDSGSPVLTGPAPQLAPYLLAVRADNPAAYYRMNEPFTNSVVGDDSGFGHDLDVVGGTAPTVGTASAKSGGSLAWGPSAGFLRTTWTQGQPTTGTFEFWIKIPAAPAAGVAVASWCPSGGSNGATSAVYLNSTGTLSLFQWVSGARYVTTPGALTTGVWHHVVASWGGSGSKIRVDKTTLATNPAYTSSQNNGSAQLRIHGEYNPGGGNLAQTAALQLADFAWYPNQLTDAQSDAHYAAAGN